MLPFVIYPDMYILFFLTLFSLCYSTPDLLILRSSDRMCTLSKHPRWLERHLPSSVPFSVIDDYTSNFSAKSDQIIFLSSLLYSYKLGKIRKIPRSVVCVQSMFETDTIPQKWVQKLNKFADLVVVPDPYLIDVYKNAGVTIPIFMLPIGCEFEKWLALPPKKSVGSPFVFLASGSLHQLRKNHDILIESFIKAFGNRKDVLLKIQVRNSNEARANELVSKYQLTKKENIQFHFGNIGKRSIKTSCILPIVWSILPEERDSPSPQGRPWP